MQKDIQVKKTVYRVFYRGVQFALPVFVATGVLRRQKVSVKRQKR